MVNRKCNYRKNAQCRDAKLARCSSGTRRAESVAEMECDAAGVSRSEEGGDEEERGGRNGERREQKRSEETGRGSGEYEECMDSAEGLQFSTHTADSGEQECKHTYSMCMYVCMYKHGQITHTHTHT